MCIFSNQVLQIENTDFTKWPTINGDAVVLETARSEYLDTCLEKLNYFMNRYVSHMNYPVWEKYADVIEDILAHRN
ncbi:hypothetical protein [[Clostridium] polysaccharolyticum]|uniref:Uncharacterized protein n=1 Tax=[Clostridium] polysaccharolyticum TaxID=29364 RepID=A0A1I0EXN1_9FIRM|nr:hypothetical protein [[Clostridium] polysaccharolyticum]SET50397.1 hypothetical protein SAMN04487772_12625 [[Clostridium] polysaccharolyticum]